MEDGDNMTRPYRAGIVAFIGAVVMVLAGCAGRGVEIPHVLEFGFSSHGEELVVQTDRQVLTYRDGTWQARDLPADGGNAPTQDL